MDFTDEEITKLCLQPGDLLVCEGGEIGRTAMWRGEIKVCGYQNHIHRLRKQRQDIWPEFYMYWLQAAFLILGLYAGEEIRTTIPNLSRGRLKSFQVPKPPLEEQQKIASVLSTIQRAIEQQDKIIEATRKLKKSLMQKLFTEGIGHTEFEETEIGEIPREWKVVRLEDVVDRKRNNINPVNYPDEVFEYYSIPAYHGNQQPVMEVGKNIRSQKFLVKEGTVLFAKLNPRVPKAWLVKSNTNKRKIASTEFIPLYPKEDRVKDLFLFYLCWSDHVLPKSQGLVSGSTPSRQRVDINAFFKIQIPLPPLPEQQQIAHILSTVDKKIEIEERRKATLKELFKTMLHKLMTGEIRLKEVEI
ncbi:hypothetical protein DRN97_10660 [Methanosarcinales archaeon]|nr:MAG: hypothetical protein DRN97_10660 [Methanosarcinales archaeon]